MRQIRPRAHTLRIGRSKIRFLLATRTRQIRISLINPRTNLTSRIRSGNKLHTQRLRQRLDHADNQLIQQSGNIPRELLRCQTRQHLQRHMHSHAIMRIMRVIHITQPQIDRGAVRAQRMPMIRIVSQRHRLGISKTLHLLRIKIQQIRLLVMLRLPPFRKIGNRRDSIGNHRIIEIEQVLVADCLRHLTCTTRIVCGILQHVTILRNEIVIREPLLNIALDQTLTNQKITGLQRIDTTPLHRTILHDRQTIQQHLRARHRGATRTRPMRIRIRGSRQRTRQRLSPSRIDLGGISRPQAARLHQLRAHHPLRRRLGNRGSREQREMRATRTLIIILRHLLRTLHGTRTGGTLQTSKIRCLRLTHDLHAHHRQQARKHRRMNTLRIPRTTQRMRSLLVQRKLTNLKRWTRNRNRITNLELEFLAHLTQLRDQILPLTNAQPTQIFSLANLTKRGITGLTVSLKHAIPQVQRGQKITGRIGIPVMNTVGLLTILIRALARILQTQKRDHHQHRGQRVRRSRLCSLDNHTAQTHVDRNAREHTARVRQHNLAMLTRHSLQFGQLIETIRHRLHIRRIDKAEIRNILRGTSHTHR